MGLESGVVATHDNVVGRQAHSGSADTAKAKPPSPDAKDDDSFLVDSNEKVPAGQQSKSLSWKAELATAAAFLAITLVSYPFTGNMRSWHYVWWCGWLTAVSTGAGAVPFLWVKDIDKFWLGVCNALAAGMMLAATSCLFYEGFHVKSHDTDVLSVKIRLLLGACAGIGFIKMTKLILDGHDGVKLGGLDGLDAQKALLIMAVMTLHSISEGIGVGVSFGGEGGDRRGVMVSLTLAIHNVPEGLAVPCLFSLRVSRHEFFYVG
ncbi:hypothetical protein, variant 1 [Aphanomyces invadans]|uniref:Uncharacterized protein n=1 Tax=Aphanomyces invadans TaxID=157072 RepID=A0A024U3D1_9STRA|nr:hypothetical protein, variant 1 [Aphanomyces invadans]ETW00769.1 hypothetical protein, variant 1 [Aphanomyces invadans]|eukprot:XP_008870904.1 hypothetical protein, variant 1 [Aphanomyces invadans]